MPVSAEFKADLDVLHRSLIANNSGVIARGRLRLLRRAVDCFGFHLARLDIRQNSAVHERTVAELLDAATPGMSYLALSEEARVALLSSELRNARPLTSPFVKYSEETLGELAVFRAAAEAHPKFGADVIPQCIISMCKGMSDMLEVALLLKEVGPRRPLRPQRDQHRAAVRDHRGFAGFSRHHGPACCRCTIIASWSTAAAACRK